VHGGDERGSGGSRLQGATDKWPQAETRQRPPTAAAQCPISDSALGRLDHPRHQKTLAVPPPPWQLSPTQPKKGSPNECGLLSGVGCHAGAVLFFLLVKALLLHRSRPFTTRASAREENSLTPRELLHFSRLLTSSSSSAAQSSHPHSIGNACGKKVASSPFVVRLPHHA
jgi:hypothetical protein